MVYNIKIVLKIRFFLSETISQVVRNVIPYQAWCPPFNRNDSSNKGSCGTMKKAKDLVLENLGMGAFLAILALWN